MGAYNMKHLSGVTIIFICLVLSSLTGIVTADSAQYEKSVSINMHIDNGKITTKSTEIYYGSAPHLFPLQGSFEGDLIATDGSIVKTFTVWDPRIQFGDTIVNDSNNPRIQGVVDRQNSVDFVVIFPFDRNVTEFRLYDSAEGTLLSSVNLKPATDSFFALYPRDPDNPASFEAGIPVMEPSPQSGIQNPVAKSSGQLQGILAIVSGAVLLMVGAFASVRSVRFRRVKQKSVLIVDDDHDIIGVIASMLKKGGGDYATRAASSGEECLKELESAVPDLILLDIGMEPMDGWETLKRIKKNPATQSVPVIMLTGLRLTPKDVEDYSICLEDYVMKPVTSHDLNDAIMHVFARRQMIEEKIAAAKRAGIDRNELCECARLTRVVDVNKRLWNLLVKTYHPGTDTMVPESQIKLAIENTEKKIRDQEHRLEQIRHNLGSGAEW
jgi:CheY-like chemotaxis protein